MISKKKLLETIHNLPEKFSVDELLDRIMLIQKIEIGLEQSNTGKVSSSSEAKKKLKKWLK